MNITDTVRISADNPHEKEIILIAGFPGSGLVGSIAVTYLIEKYGFTKIGSVISPLLPMASTAVMGLAQTPVRIYEKGNMIAVASDVPIPDEASYVIPAALIEWLSLRTRIREILVLGGVITGGTGERVFGVATTPEGVEKLARITETLPALNITGSISGFLSEACMRNIPALGLLVETNFDVDPRASAAGLTAAANLYNILLDTQPLIDQADTVEPMLRQLAEDVKNSETKPISYDGDIMYG
ncbi:MAG: PAC2 family protein [Methanocorpusculum sp.]|nr:PAC2 family protein [Methanocorpusculum sp.]